ncbi:E3 ubiquitin/ISG15 ligase TRIM25-like isoform X2 [Aquarana catesbeiana]|uniref:E3 ubiquitin/ISG15 ligase TRIM25-like isoform X2 n=1 Tax=Aquarana catesbeiana TaxID=8400 RepID=UPI003CC93687
MNRVQRMANVTEDLSCSTCGNPCTDPVSLPCLHRFCRLCILHELDTQKSAKVYFCPQCRMQFEERPPMLHKKRRLYVKETVPCTYCDDPAPAEKTCLHCEDSLCAKHLTRHSTAPEHVLIEPTASLEDRKCTKHRQLLDHYCIEDKVFICFFCYIAGDHKGHEVMSLNIDSAVKGKEYLIPLIKNLRWESKNIETQINSLEDQEAAQARKPHDVSKRVTDQIQNIKEDLEDLQKKVLNEVDTQKRKVAESVLDCKKKLEDQRQELCRKISEIQKLHDIRDPLTFLNKVMGTDLIGIFNVEQIKVSGDQLCETPISEMLHKELLQFTDGLNKQLLMDAFPKTQELCNISDPLTFLKIVMGTDRFDETPISEMQHKELLQFADRLINLLLKDVFPKMKKSEITLDMKTAHCKIIIRRKPINTAYYTANRQARRGGPERFRSQHVLSGCKFSSGNHYWEVEVNRIQCSIGVVYNNIERKKTGDNSRIGYNRKSWALSIDDKLSAWHNYTKTKIPTDSPVRSFGIFLEYEAGRLSFYQLCDPIRHLHTFTTTFTKPLHAAFYLGDGSKITILN